MRLQVYIFEGVDSTSFNYGTTGQRANTLGLSPKLKIDQRKVYLYFINLSTWIKVSWTLSKWSSCKFGNSLLKSMTLNTIDANWYPAMVSFLRFLADLLACSRKTVPGFTFSMWSSFKLDQSLLAWQWISQGLFLPYRNFFWFRDLSRLRVVNALHTWNKVGMILGPYKRPQIAPQFWLDRQLDQQVAVPQ